MEPSGPVDDVVEIDVCSSGRLARQYERLAFLEEILLNQGEMTKELRNCLWSRGGKDVGIEWSPDEFSPVLDKVLILQVLRREETDSEWEDGISEERELHMICRVQLEL